jgi:hypothetical protein
MLLPHGDLRGFRWQEGLVGMVGKVSRVDGGRC